jgi:hypothetical protein
MQREEQIKRFFPNGFIRKPVMERGWQEGEDRAGGMQEFRCPISNDMKGITGCSHP